MDEQKVKYRSPVLQGLFDYWASKWNDGRLPGRQHIDPAEILKMWPSLYLIDVVRLSEQPRFRFRYVGEEIANKFLRDATGKWFDELYDTETYERLVVGYRKALDTKRPNHALLNMPIEGREYILYERLVCPLAADGDTVDMLIGVLDFPQR